MNRNNKKIVLALIMLLTIGRIQAQGIVSKVNQFRDGDRICFIGNSITHAGSYHSLLYLFYLTRFPERNLEVFNCGISGDNVGGTLKRFNKDIAVHVPSVATIKLGTNDICPELYFNSDPQKHSEKVKANSMYRSNMMELVRRLDSMGTKIIFLTPAYFEEKPRPDGMNVVGINKVFEQYGQFLDSLRMQYKAGLVDFHFILDSISLARQKTNKDFTLNSLDRVHPLYDGHFVMAFSFFKALGLSPFISNTEIHVKSKKVLNQVNCTANNLRFSKDEIFFQIMENSLPFPTSAYPKDTMLIPFTRMFNQEILSVKGLTLEGKYELTIDTTVVAEYTGKQLGAGINLALFPSTPQMKQSEQIAILNEKRRQIEVQLRDMKLVEYKMLNPDEQLLGKAEKSEILNQRLKISEGKSWHGYYKMIFKFYMENSDKKEEKVRAIGQLVKDIYKKNKPLTHNYILKKIHQVNKTVKIQMNSNINGNTII